MQCTNCDHHLTPECYEFRNCQTCGHPVTLQNFDDEVDEFHDYHEDIDDGFNVFQCCDNCDLPDACSDFGCAIKSGLKQPSDRH